MQAGILEDREADTDVQAAVRDDLLLTERQKQVLLDIYASFLRENELAGVFPAERTGGGHDEPRDGRPEGKAAGRKATGDKTAGDKTAGPASNGSDGPERAMPNKSAKRSAHQSAKQAAQRTQSEQDGKEEVG